MTRTLTDEQVTSLLAAVIVSLTKWDHWTTGLKEMYATDSAKAIMQAVVPRHIEYEDICVGPQIVIPTHVHERLSREDLGSLCDAMFAAYHAKLRECGLEGVN